MRAASMVASDYKEEDASGVHDPLIYPASAIKHTLPVARAVCCCLLVSIIVVATVIAPRRQAMFQSSSAPSSPFLTREAASYQMRVLMIRCVYKDHSPDGDEGKVWQDLFGGEGTISTLAETWSYGRLTIPSSKARVVTVKMGRFWENDGCSNWDGIRPEARQKVREQHPNVNLDDFDLHQFYIPSWVPSSGPYKWTFTGVAASGCHPSLLPVPGGCYAVFRVPRPQTQAHEFGHTVGLQHAGGPSGFGQGLEGYLGGLKCMIPFKYNGATYHTCKSAATPWCPTLLDSNGAYIPKDRDGNIHHAECSPDCTSAPQCRTRDDGWYEYGDGSDMMGGGFITAPWVSWSAHGREFLGFLAVAAGEVIEWQPSRKHPATLSSLHLPPHHAGSEAVAIKFPCPKCTPKSDPDRWEKGGFLWVQYYGDMGDDFSYGSIDSKKELQQKVYVHFMGTPWSPTTGGISERIKVLDVGDVYEDQTVSQYAVRFCSKTGDSAKVLLYDPGESEGHCDNTPANNAPAVLPGDCVDRVRGEKCKFPTTYKGATYNSCISEDSASPDSQWCYLDGHSAKGQKRWGVCSDSCFCHTKLGHRCMFPFTSLMRGGRRTEYNSCAPLAGGGTWCATSVKDDRTYTKWGLCEDSCSTEEGAEQAGPCVGKETDEKCQFPFTHEDKTYFSCTPDGNQGTDWCRLPGLNSEGLSRWDACSDSCVAKGPCVDNEHNACKFPFTYDGNIYNACTKDGADSYWCRIHGLNSGGLDWGYCSVACVADGGTDRAAVFN